MVGGLVMILARFMLDYLHGNITKQLSPTNPADVGAKFDAVAMPLRSLSDHVLCKLRQISMGFVASKR